ncbi:hypothetical protein ACWGJV_37640, partial [Streptomyces tendae]
MSADAGSLSRVRPVETRAALDSYGLDELHRLVAEQLREWNHERFNDPSLPNLVSEGYSTLHTAWKGQPLKRQSTLIANWIVRGSFETLVGGGTSVEGEINNLLFIPSQVRAKRGDVLAIGPGGLQIVIEEKEFFATPDDLLYRTERDATEAGEESEPEDVYIFEVIPGIMSNAPGELYADRNVGMEAYRYVEEALAWVDSQIPAGTSATIPMSTIFPDSGGWQLTHIGAEAGVGSKPIGDPGGAHVHYNIAVPFATIPEFLREVGSRTWRDQGYGYHTRAHLADGLDFAAMATTRFLAWTATGQIPSSPADLGNVIDIPIREAQELRGHLALLYVSSAALVNGKIRLGPLYKAHAAVLVRHNQGDLLRMLSSQARSYLTQDAAFLMRQFEFSIRQRLQIGTDSHPATIFDIMLLDLQHKLGDFFLTGLQESYPRAVGLNNAYTMTVLDGVDYLEANHQIGRAARIPRVVLEVRSYGQRLVDHRDMRAWHDRLALTAESLHQAVVYSATEEEARAARDQALQQIRHRVILANHRAHNAVVNVRSVHVDSSVPNRRVLQAAISKLPQGHPRRSGLEQILATWGDAKYSTPLPISEVNKASAGLKSTLTLDKLRRFLITATGGGLLTSIEKPLAGFRESAKIPRVQQAPLTGEATDIMSDGEEKSDGLSIAGTIAPLTSGSSKSEVGADLTPAGTPPRATPDHVPLLAMHRDGQEEPPAADPPPPYQRDNSASEAAEDDALPDIAPPSYPEAVAAGTPA